MAHRPIALTLVAIFGLFAVALFDQGRAGAGSSPEPSRPALGELDLRTPRGEKVSLIPFIGRKAVVVVFWAAWCPICRKEVPHLNQLNSSPLVKVIGVNEGESLQVIKTFVADNKPVYDIVLDPKGAVAKSFGVPGMPYCVIIGKSGVIAYRGYGLPADLDSYFRQ
jgi:thiol-disulfide isomerase/thioredoxin